MGLVNGSTLGQVNAYSMSSKLISTLVTFLFIADEMLGVPRARALSVPEPELCERGPLPTRVGPLRVGVPGSVRGVAVSSRPAHGSAGNLGGPVSGPGGGAHLARLAHFQR